MSEVATYNPIQVLVYDPTKTLTLRTAFVGAMNRRFKALIKVIREAVVDMDCFGLTATTYAEVSAPYYQAFNFPSIEEKVGAFMAWLMLQEDRGILETQHTLRTGVSVEEAWTNVFVEEGYKRGVQRARSEMRRSGYDISTDEALGGLAVILAQPHHVSRLTVAQNRAITELRGAVAQMNTKLSQVLAQGLIDGDGVESLARKLISVINGKNITELGVRDSLGRFIPAQQRAQMIARTEIVRAHHWANMQEYENWGVLGVQVMAEFTTAMDERVCTECSGYHGNVYTLKEAEFMIPVHPNCRCIALPVMKKK